MAHAHVWIRESVGAILSAGFTVGLFGLPLLTLLSPGTAHSEVVSIEPYHAAAVVVDSDLLERLFQEAGAVDQEPGVAAPEASREALPEDGPEADEAPQEEGSEGEDARDGGGTPQVAEAAEAVEKAGAPEPVAQLPEREAPGRARTVKKPGTAEEAARQALAGLFGDDGEGGGSGGKKRGSRARCNKPMPEIQAAGERYWTVERDLVEYYTASFARLNSLGWSGRYDEGDERGWKISGFGCNSPLYRAGLRRGDVIQSVNGRKTYNLVQVFATWKKLRKMDEFEVQVLRRGETIRLTYRLI